MKEEIKAWLQSPRDYAEGVRIYQQYGFNRVLKNNFARINTAQSRATLTLELARIAGISEDELKGIKQYAVKPTPKKTKKEATVEDLILELSEKLNTAIDDIFSLESNVEDLSDEVRSDIDKLKSKYAEIPETSKKVIRFREKYPFLSSPDCPNELKIMVADMFTAYDKYREEYLQLDTNKPDDENLIHAQAVVENYLENRTMWEELDYFAENNKVLGKHPIFERLKLEQEIQAIHDIDLPKKLSNGKSNITKANNAIAAAKTDVKLEEAKARLAKWTEYCSVLETEIEKRKK